ncbi:MAG: hypothetical protein V1729_02890 [Candidatus Woesearchaeota archaeon]
MALGDTYIMRPELKRYHTLPFQDMDEEKARIVTEFYNRIKNKDTAVLERYLAKLLPGNWLDKNICYARDRQRQARHAATYQLLNQREQKAFNDSIKGLNKNPARGNTSDETACKPRKVRLPSIDGMVLTTWNQYRRKYHVANNDDDTDQYTN